MGKFVTDSRQSETLLKTLFFMKFHENSIIFTNKNIISYLFQKVCFVKLGLKSTTF